MKDIKDISDGDVIELAKLIKTKDWDGKKEVSYFQKFYEEPFYEMYQYAKGYAINSIYYSQEIWDFLNSKGYDVSKVKIRK